MGVGVNVCVGVTVTVDVTDRVLVGVTTVFNVVPQLETTSNVNAIQNSKTTFLIKRLEGRLISLMDDVIGVKNNLSTVPFIQQNPVEFCSH